MTERGSWRFGGLLASAIKRAAEDLKHGAAGRTKAGSPLTFVEFVDAVAPRYRWYEHNRRLARVLQRAADGEIRRLMVFMPPRHGKSELVSRLFAAYYLYRHPDRWVGLASYSANLAYPLSKAARSNFQQAGGALDPAARSVREWQTTSGGGLWAAGVGGSMTGKGWNLGIIDDPIKDAAAAESELVREGQKDWYRSTFYTRSMPPDLLIVVQTLWNPDDLSGWLLGEEEAEVQAGADGEPERWHIVCLPALRPPADEERRFPASCRVEPDWREVGEPLWPERFGRERLRRIERNAGDWWAPLYQQSPVPASGLVLQPSWFPIVRPEHVPRLSAKVAGVDLAVAARDQSDFTVAFPMGWAADGRYYLFRPYRERAEAPDAESEIAALARRERCQTIGVESVAFQLSFVQYLRRRPDLAGIPVLGIRVDGDKVARARGWAPMARQGQIVLVEDGTGWTQTFLDEAKHFPKGKRDQVDALGIALSTLAEIGHAAAAPLVGGRVNPPFQPR